MSASSPVTIIIARAAGLTAGSAYEAHVAALPALRSRQRNQFLGALLRAPRALSGNARVEFLQEPARRFAERFQVNPSVSVRFDDSNEGSIHGRGNLSQGHG